MREGDINVLPRDPFHRSLHGDFKSLVRKYPRETRLSTEIPGRIKRRRNSPDGSRGSGVGRARSKRDPKFIEEEDVEESDQSIQSPNEERRPHIISKLGPVHVRSDQEDQGENDVTDKENLVGDRPKQWLEGRENQQVVGNFNT